MMSVGVLLCLSVVVMLSDARGAGRSFPIDSENFVCEQFEKINTHIEWDPTNFLVDLSGHYANCKALKKPMGVFSVEKLTPDGSSITGVVDSIQGSGTDVVATNGYIEAILKRWISARAYHGQIREASRFGCSVRPGCDGFVVVACLFAPSGNVQKDRTEPQQLKQLTTTTTTTRKPTPAATTTPTTTTSTTTEPLTGEQRALAFTPQQYDVAAQVLGKAWDQSHYLENLSGFETSCSMIDTASWPFDHTNKFNKRQSLDIKGQYGYVPNKGSTPNALLEILNNPTFKNALKSAKDLGCSLIPDCIKDRNMFVVVACLYEE
jgi:hypothetical protein